MGDPLGVGGIAVEDGGRRLATQAEATHPGAGVGSDVAAREADARVGFSPDGRWVAYVSDESGEDEIYVRPFPGPGAKWQVTTEGGSRPTFSANGKQLYFVGPEGPLEVDIEASASGFRTGASRTLIDVSYDELDLRDEVVLPDGSEAIVIRNLPKPYLRREMELILNWRPPAP